jgi:transcriptional regulator with XRE-family HTH domain
MAQEKIIQVVDQEVGARVRLRRKLIGMSQEKLAAEIGVTFQQVQKYEKGTNRIGSSRMHQISVALGVSVTSLFGDGDGLSPSGIDPFGSEDSVISKDGIDLNKAFLKIKDTGIRKSVIELVVSLSKAS